MDAGGKIDNITSADTVTVIPVVFNPFSWGTKKQLF